MSYLNHSFQRIAVLIDGDNTSTKSIECILNKISSLGTITCKRIYGDFKQGSLSNWDDISLKLLLEQVHIPAYVKGKNATDIALAIDAVDLSYGDYDCFCIVSSDSDFSILAKNLRTKHKKVYGFGKATAVESFRLACDDFFDFDSKPVQEKLTVAPNNTPKINSQPTLTKQKNQIPTAKLKQDTSLMNACRESIKQHLQNDGWAHFSKVVSHITLNFPKISPNNYGYAKWKSLFNQIDIFETKNQDNILLIRQITAKKSTSKQPVQPNNQKLAVKDKKLIADIIEIINNNSQPKNGWMHIGQFGSQLKAKGHEAKKYGYKSFTQLAEHTKELVVKKEGSIVLAKIKT